MAADMTNIAIVEREAKLEGKNMFMILAPRAVPLGPPKFTHVKDSVVDAAVKAQNEEHPDDHDHDDREPEPVPQPQAIQPQKSDPVGA
jgi:hypothetical protein